MEVQGDINKVNKFIEIINKGNRFIRIDNLDIRKSMLKIKKRGFQPNTKKCLALSIMKDVLLGKTSFMSF